MGAGVAAVGRRVPAVDAAVRSVLGGELVGMYAAVTSTIRYDARAARARALNGAERRAEQRDLHEFVEVTGAYIANQFAAENAPNGSVHCRNPPTRPPATRRHGTLARLRPLALARDRPVDEDVPSQPVATALMALMTAEYCAGLPGRPRASSGSTGARPGLGGAGPENPGGEPWRRVRRQPVDVIAGQPRILDRAQRSSMVRSRGLR